jgi:hypothetical protein
LSPRQRPRSESLLRAAVLTLTFALTLTARIWGINRHFWMLGDQIRDWSIALGPLTSLPFVGPPTHVRGYTIGPAFYWILWAIRVTVGPWFQNLPHAGGIGQAALSSAADALLLAAVWKRTRSIWLALASIVLIASSAYDLCLAPLVWNPVVGVILAKTATALVLLGWHVGSPTQIVLCAAAAWSAVHAYTGTIYVAAGVFGAALIEPLVAGDWRKMARSALLIGAVIAVLQLPYALHQLSTGFRDPAMGAVTGSLARLAAGTDQPEFAKSLTGYVGAFDFIQGFPSRVPGAPWVLGVCSLVVAFRYRRDPAMLMITLVPQGLALVGYALFLGSLDQYYYLSLMPAAVLTVLLAATAVPRPRVQTMVSIVLLVGALLAVPARLRFAATMHKLPEYGALVDGSRKIARLKQPMRAIETEFQLLPTSDPTFVYRILGGEIDRSSPWVGRITARGDVLYRKVEP